MTIEQAIEQYDQFANVCKYHGLTASQEEFEQLATLLRELQERRKAPEIIFCKDCEKHNKRFDEYPADEACPLTVWRVAQGHEFDYQYCAFAERRTDG